MLLFVFDSVGRRHIGSYLCIASNGVPPSISKRVDLRVQCEHILGSNTHSNYVPLVPPMMDVPSQVEGAQVGGCCEDV